MFSVHSAAWSRALPLLHCLPCHELVLPVFTGGGISPWHETKSSHSQGPQATQVCSSSTLVSWLFVFLFMTKVLKVLACTMFDVVATLLLERHCNPNKQRPPPF